MWLYLRLFLVGLRRLNRSRRDLVLEHLVLRQQLAVYARAPRRTPLQSADRRFWSTVARGWPGWRRHVHVVEPATVVRWHPTAWRRYWRWRSRARRPGRPRIPAETRVLIIRRATENPRWGAQRIADELRALGIDVSRATVDRYRPPRALARPQSGRRLPSRCRSRWLSAWLSNRRWGSTGTCARSSQALAH